MMETAVDIGPGPGRRDCLEGPASYPIPLDAHPLERALIPLQIHAGRCPYPLASAVL